MKASINKIESFSTVDGPGIRTVIFFNGCNLRCKFCHNPEMWIKKEDNTTVDELFQKIIKNKPYFEKNGGVTFSGGEPLLHNHFLLEICKKLKEEKIHIAIETSGITKDNPQELLKLVDLVILDIKGINQESFKKITLKDYYNNYNNFIKELNNSKKEIWIRQVIIPNENDTVESMKELSKHLKNLHNITNIELLPFHTMGFEKYKELGIYNQYHNKTAMDKLKTNQLEEYIKKEHF